MPGALLELKASPGISLLAADTDGIDGSGDNAEALGISGAGRLYANDSYGFFSALGDLLITGPTLTNVNISGQSWFYPSSERAEPGL